MDGAKIVKLTKVALGGQPVGRRIAREIQDSEGIYSAWTPRIRTASFTKHCTFLPKSGDRANARKLGVSPGGDVEIHGWDPMGWWRESTPDGLDSWTDGCVADQRGNRRNLSVCKVGTPVEIRP